MVICHIVVVMDEELRQRKGMYLIQDILPNNNPKSVRNYYIYLKIGEKAKGQTLSNGFAPNEKRYHTNFCRHDTCVL